MSAAPHPRSRVPAWPRVSRPRRAAASALAAGLALLVALPAGAQPAPAGPAPEKPAAAAPAPAQTPVEPTGATPAPAQTPVEPAGATAENPAEPAAEPAAAGQSAPADAVEPAADTVGNLSARRSWGWVAVGTAAAFATTSAMLGLAVESREADIAFLIDFRAPIVGAPNRYEGEARGRYEELVDEAETLSKFAWITLGLAGAAALTATALFVLDGGVSAEGTPGARSQLAPAVSPGAVPGGGMGVTLDWEF